MAKTKTLDDYIRSSDYSSLQKALNVKFDHEDFKMIQKWEEVDYYSRDFILWVLEYVQYIYTPRSLIRYTTPIIKEWADNGIKTREKALKHVIFNSSKGVENKKEELPESQKPKAQNETASKEISFGDIYISNTDNIGIIADLGDSTTAIYLNTLINRRIVLNMPAETVLTRMYGGITKRIINLGCYYIPSKTAIDFLQEKDDGLHIYITNLVDIPEHNFVVPGMTKDKAVDIMNGRIPERLKNVETNTPDYAKLVIENNETEIYNQLHEALARIEEETRILNEREWKQTDLKVEPENRKEWDASSKQINWVLNTIWKFSSENLISMCNKLLSTEKVEMPYPINATRTDEGLDAGAVLYLVSDTINFFDTSKTVNEIIGRKDEYMNKSALISKGKDWMDSKYGTANK